MRHSSLPYKSNRFWIIIGSCVFLIFLGIVAFTLTLSSNNLSVTEETQEKHYQRGLRLLKEGRDQEALSAFLKVIEKRNDAPESHLEVGRLYLNYIEDPIAAIYHFRKYLEFSPNSDQAPMVRQLIDTARKQFVKSLPGQPYQDEMERVDLLKLLEETREDNVKLKRKLALAKKRFDEIQQLIGPDAAHKLSAAMSKMEHLEASDHPHSHSSLSSSSLSSSSPSAKPHTPPPPPKEYLVEPGDTLSTISKKVYGTSNRWKEILAANNATLSSPNALKPGQILKIP